MRSSSKILMALSGFLFILTGISCLCNIQATMLSIAWLLGLFTVVSGIINLFVYISGGRKLPNSSYMLIIAITDILIGIMFLANQFIVAGIIPYIFATWLLFAGLQTALHAFDFKQVGFRAWWVIFALGLLATLFALGSYIAPIVAAVTITLLLGIALIIRGLNQIFILIGISKLEKSIIEE